MLGHSHPPAGIAGTSASHPSAAAATVSNCAAINSAARRGTPAAGGGVAPVTSGRIGWPSGTSGTPTPASRSATSSSGGAHTRTSAPRARHHAASPTTGSTHPRDPDTDTNTRIRFSLVLSLVRRFWPVPVIIRLDPGLAASPPGRDILRVESGGGSPSPLFSVVEGQAPREAAYVLDGLVYQDARKAGQMRRVYLLYHPLPSASRFPGCAQSRRSHVV